MVLRKSRDVSRHRQNLDKLKGSFIDAAARHLERESNFQCTVNSLPTEVLKTYGRITMYGFNSM
eukprot:2141155-Ditylum_brightwellii.AAC.1